MSITSFKGQPQLGHSPRRRPLASPTPPNHDEADGQKKPEFPRGQVNAQWPPPPQQHQFEPMPQPPPPPPAAPTASSDLSSESVRLLSEEESNKEQVFDLKRLINLSMLSLQVDFSLPTVKYNCLQLYSFYMIA